MLVVSVFFAILLQISIAEQSNLSRTYEFPETQIETFWPMLDNKNLVYARCNSSLMPGSSKGCIVGIKLDAFEDSIGATKECTVTLKPEKPNTYINDSLQVFAFGNDNILVVWMEMQNASDAEKQIGWTKLKTTVVHMSDNCLNFEAEVHMYKGQPDIDFDCQQPNVVTFKDTYEVILKNAKSQCKSGSDEYSYGYDIYKFDSQGRKLSGPDCWPEPPLRNGSSYVTSNDFKQLKEGYFISTQNDTSYIVELMDKDLSDHKKQEIWKLSTNESRYEQYRVSLTNGAISFGYILRNSTVGCWQADQKGNMRVNTHFTFQDPIKAKLSFIYNLRNGGLLLAVIKYTDSEWHTHDTYELMRVNEEGQVNSKEIRFEKQCTHDDGVAILQLFENKKGQYCMVRLCQSNLHKPGRLETAVRCYSSDEFSRCDLKICFVDFLID